MEGDQFGTISNPTMDYDQRGYRTESGRSMDETLKDKLMRVGKELILAHNNVRELQKEFDATMGEFIIDRESTAKEIAELAADIFEADPELG